MRLVSAIYNEWFPFADFGPFDDLFATNDPADLVAGDCLVIWGGGDISPALYGKRRSSYGGGGLKPSHRDQIEWDMMLRAKELGCPIIGVCRGGQMLTALEGGHLIQHVDGHAGYGHTVSLPTGEIFKVNSIHHQMMVPPKNGSKFDMVAVATPRLSKEYHDVGDDGSDLLVEMGHEPEFIYYPEVKGFAIQWHPEGMHQNSEANRFLKEFMVARL
jgi:gamma-glutamyl-gamma-aminobutyrate hydrolase PuuD